jgi:molecular chaperone GrpE
MEDDRNSIHEPIEENTMDEDTPIEAETASEVEEAFVDVEALQADLQTWQAKAAEYLDGWQRARAEFANYKKRVDRDQAQMHENITASVVKRFLDVMDDLDRALKNRPKEGDGAAWADGVELANRKFYTILESSGVTPIDAQGQYFDPNLHEAISNEEAEGFEDGQIIEVVKQGYLIGDRVLRPAQVRVAK